MAACSCFSTMDSWLHWALILALCGLGQIAETPESLFPPLSSGSKIQSDLQDLRMREKWMLWEHAGPTHFCLPPPCALSRLMGYPHFFACSRPTALLPLGLWSQHPQKVALPANWCLCCRIGFLPIQGSFTPNQTSGALGSIFVSLFLRMYFLIGVVSTWATLSTQSPSSCGTSPQSSPTSQCEPPHRIHYIFPLALVALLSGDSWLLCFPDPFSRALRLCLWQPHIRASLLSPVQTEGWDWSSLKSPLRTRHRSVKLYSKCSPLLSHVHGTMPD